ncbi:signal peptide peptidase SppA [Aliarcobacter cryaerophilus ATCC 43158]|uniref:Signal peptide peptidase protease IV n=1 Tax=Aliarcobacter cryaerophilus ATCC 43158 TaxID=1032070 RepID=A0AAD0XAQ4_9BACT|nr:signal peptide peptidase SppA [Aliarcobacter cryaerophilus]AYJ80603.1 signal peptide peptidase protease IV [Aliarcobacter cryaerophilus ATCC 43158]PRM99302.1 signal peptide peptidase SppA [Aliarcobacter cryaerophilus]QCZ22937.1 signal peptide peptidase SppA [Aliarcobacter cryaerophilus ATCC 43158]
MFDFLKKLFLPVVWFLDFITKYFKTIVFLTIVYFIFFSGAEDETIAKYNANLQKIDLVGQIIDPSKVLEDIERASNDASIKGVLFVIDSPGGAVAPSVEIAYAIKELSMKKPVVAYASGTIASGSYYASIWADKIIANPGSIVGSIGVIMQGFEASKLLENLGISSQTIKAGKYKESGTFTRKWTNDEEQELQGVINSTYNMFISDVADARKLDIKKHTSFADAKIFTAHQAKDVGLVDEVATLNFAKHSLIELSKVEKPIWKKEDKFEKFMDKLMSQAISKVLINFSSSLKAY